MLQSIGFSHRFLFFVGFCVACSSADKGSSVESSDSSTPSWWETLEIDSGDVDSEWAVRWSEIVTPIGVGAMLIEDLASGSKIDLSWAQQSAVACFPANQDELFSGPHRFFVMQQESDQALTVRVEPEPGVDISLYTLQQSTESFVLPPETVSAVSCDASLNGTEGDEEALWLWGPNNPYNVIVGVAGVRDQAEGRYLLSVTTDD
jgi:hypothetical protein